MQMKNPIFKVCFSLSLRFLLVLLLLLFLLLLNFSSSLFYFLHMQRGWFLIRLRNAVHVLETTALVSGSFSRFLLFARLLYIFWSHQQDIHTHTGRHME